MHHSFDAESDGCPAVWNPSHRRELSITDVPLFCFPADLGSSTASSTLPALTGFGVNAGFLGYPLTSLRFLLKKLTKPKNKQKINMCQLLSVDI